MAADRRVARIIESRSPSLATIPATDENPGLRGHAVVIGSGRVGRLIIGALARRGFPFVVVSDDRRDIERLRAQGRPALFGDASNTELLDRASVASARVVVVAIPDAHVARLIVQHARQVNPRVALVVRTHDQRHLAEVASLGGHAQAIHGELELGVQMTRYTLRRFGISTIEAEAIAEGLRGRGGRPWPLDPM
jgi:CPA2 family monovalent cation:H+ antiporter-2